MILYTGGGTQEPYRRFGCFREQIDLEVELVRRKIEFSMPCVWELNSDLEEKDFIDGQMIFNEDMWDSIKSRLVPHLPPDDITVACTEDRLAVPKGKRVFDVRDFGAVGDGVTDDRPAIQAAIAAAEADGGSVLISGGTYDLKEPLVIDKANLHIENVHFINAPPTIVKK